MHRRVIEAIPFLLTFIKAISDIVSIFGAAAYMCGHAQQSIKDIIIIFALIVFSQLHFLRECHQHVVFFAFAAVQIDDQNIGTRKQVFDCAAVVKAVAEVAVPFVVAHQGKALAEIVKAVLYQVKMPLLDVLEQGKNYHLRALEVVYAGIYEPIWLGEFLLEAAHAHGDIVVCAIKSSADY